MHRYVATWLSLAALWQGCQNSANAIPPPQQPLEAAAAREVKQPHPDGCLAAWPTKQTLEGRLIGIVQGPFPEEDPHPTAKAFLFLLLDYPIAVCASPSNGYPAYEDVTRIRITTFLSLSDFLHVMQTWGSDEIRITSTLNTAQTYGQEPGPVIFDAGDLKFCWQSVATTDDHAGAGQRRDEPGWMCNDSSGWVKRSPGPR